MSRPWSLAGLLCQNCLWPGYLDQEHVQALVLAGLLGQSCLWPGYLDMKHVQALVNRRPAR
jgi:hypothetical protein